MKIIATSNFNANSISDVLVCENVQNYWGIKIIQALREVMNEDDMYYVLLVEDDYKLYEFNPNQ